MKGLYESRLRLDFFLFFCLLHVITSILSCLSYHVMSV